ncbi:MAG: hypothetical protein ACTSQP_20480 [Promethearchaeota archaeon]
MSEKIIIYPPETPEQRLFWEVFFLFLMIIVIGIFGRLSAENVFFTILITILFLINLTLRFILINEKGDWIFYVLGVLGGGGNDLMSMINDVYNYNSKVIIPILDGLMPLWMILFWGQVFLLFRKIFNISWFKGEEFNKNGRFLNGWVDNKLIFDILLIIILRAIIYQTYKLDFWIPALFYIIGVFLRFIIFPPKKNEIFIICILPYAFIFEGLMVTFGLYEYYNPVFLGMPLWLFIWWIFLVPIFLKEIFDRIEFFLKSKIKK